MEAEVVVIFRIILDESVYVGLSAVAVLRRQLDGVEVRVASSLRQYFRSYEKFSLIRYSSQ